MKLNPKEEAVLKLIDKDIVYENYFFKKVSELKWFFPLKEKGYFSPERAPKPVKNNKEGYFFIPEWNVLQYLERVSHQIKKSKDEKIINELLEIIKNVTYYHVENNKALDNYRTWYYFTKILINIPNNMIPFEVIEFIPIWLDSKFDTSLLGSEIATKLLPKFLSRNPDDIQKAEIIIKSITEIKFEPSLRENNTSENEEKVAKLVIHAHWLKEVFDQYADVIGKKCSENVVYDLTENIKKLLKDKTYGTYRSFYQEPKYLVSDPFYILTYGLKRILLAKARSNIEATKLILRQFLQDEYLYFPKMALFVIGKNAENYSDVFWEVLDKPIGEVIFKETYVFGDELRHVLKNLKDVDNYINKLQEKIEKSAEAVAPEEGKEKYIPLHKQAFYEALSHHPHFKKLYNEMKKVTQRDIKLEPAVGEVEVVVGPGSSPLTTDDILAMTNKELSDFMATFRTVNSIKGPTVEGFAALLKEVVKERPEKFTEDLFAFENAGFLYIYHILHGLKDAWGLKKEISWKSIFQFLKIYIEKQDFWEDKFMLEDDHWQTNHEWIIGIIGELIQEGSKDDNWAFPEELLKDAEEILFSIFDKWHSPQRDEITDYLSHSLNHPMGKLITAFIFLALRIARINEKQQQNKIKWAKKYRAKYNELLQNGHIDAYTLFGHYMPNLYYLDRRWVKAEVNALLKYQGKENWEAFISGFLTVGRFYIDLYKLMRPHLHFALNFKFKDERIGELLVHHIAFAYLWKIDSGEGSLFGELIEKFNYKQINEVIGFFWEQEKYLKQSDEKPNQQVFKILNFWKQVYEKYKEKDESNLTIEDKKILSNILRLTVFLPSIDEETFEWLKQAVPYVNEDYNAPFFIEYLNDLKERGDKKQNAKYIGEIYLLMIKRSENQIPDYNKKHIRSIMEFLYANGAGDLAFEICDIYLRNDYKFLKDLQDKYNRN